MVYLKFMRIFILLLLLFHNRIRFVGARLITVILNHCLRLSLTTTKKKTIEIPNYISMIEYKQIHLTTNHRQHTMTLVLMYVHCTSTSSTYACLYERACQTFLRTHIRASVK